MEIKDSENKKYIYEFGDYRFSPDAKSLWRAGELVSLPPRSLEVLEMLLEKPFEIVTRDEIIERVV